MLQLLSKVTCLGVIVFKGTQAGQERQRSASAATCTLVNAYTSMLCVFQLMQTCQSLTALAVLLVATCCLLLTDRAWPACRSYRAPCCG